MAVGAGVAVDRRADRTGDAGERLQALQSVRDGEVHQVLQDGTGIGVDAAVGRHQPFRAKTQHDAAESLVGDDQVGAAADDHGLEAALLRRPQSSDEGFRAAGFRIQVGRAADAESRITGERRTARKRLNWESRRGARASLP